LECLYEINYEVHKDTQSDGEGQATNASYDARVRDNYAAKFRNSSNHASSSLMNWLQCQS